MLFRQYALRFQSVFDPKSVSATCPVTLSNFQSGVWTPVHSYSDIVDPLNGDVIIRMPNTSMAELEPFIEKMKMIPKSGLHNPLKNVERYNLYGDISFRLAASLQDPQIEEHFARCIQRVAPKSYAQCLAEVRVVQKFLMNFSGDQVRFLARGFQVSGDHAGQQSQGYRWPYGACVIISPFNFPLEIPVLQLMGALYMGNHVTIKAASTVSVVMEEWVRLMLECGMPPDDVNLIHSSGSLISRLIEEGKPRMTQFTGSSSVAELLAAKTNGKIKIEDAGFDWKILGPDVSDLDFVAWTSDQDAYAHSGQKCSAQSMLFVHENWIKSGFLDKIRSIASERSLDDLTIGPVLSHTTSEILDHAEAIVSTIPGSLILFGGHPIEKNHKIPNCYGAVVPTAVQVCLRRILESEEFFKLVTKEIFGPFQVVVAWKSMEQDLAEILKICEKMDHHLTAAVVSKDVSFINRVLSSTVNGTTYAGIRARTTGAPQNHWFGPAGDPRGAGIGSPEAIRQVWSCHREIIRDEIAPENSSWTRPSPS